MQLANQEGTTPVWFALRLGPSTFGIFDAFRDDAGRKAHLAGPVAASLMALDMPESTLAARNFARVPDLTPQPSPDFEGTYLAPDKQ